MASSPAAFTGSIPELYDRHLGPVLFEPYAIELARRAPADADRVLEVAAGTGRVTRQLLGALPATASVIATDLNEPMLDRAAQLLTDPRVTWRAADAQALPFADAAFDLVVCQFGLMFVPDKPRAVREMRRVLRTGGRALVCTWDHLEHNAASKLIHDLVLAELPTDPALFMLIPFSMPDPAALRALFRDAGFAQVEVETVQRTGDSASAADLAVGFVRGTPLWNQLVERGIAGPVFERVVTDALAARFGAQPCRSPLSAHVITAIA
jgi:ubiquinone/menaquinone biosynthesis C-methylase UbiE